jgi:hypothetical protein
MTGKTGFTGGISDLPALTRRLGGKLWSERLMPGNLAAVVAVFAAEGRDRRAPIALGSGFQ